MAINSIVLRVYKFLQKFAYVHLDLDIGDRKALCFALS